MKTDSIPGLGALAPELLPITQDQFAELVSTTGLTPAVVAFALLGVHNVRESSRRAVNRARLDQLGSTSILVLSDAEVSR